MTTVIHLPLPRLIIVDFLLYQAAWCATLLISSLIFSLENTVFSIRKRRIIRWWDLSAFATNNCDARDTQNRCGFLKVLYFLILYTFSLSSQ